MSMVCAECGEYTRRESIRGTERICGSCGAAESFRKLPLFCVTGASGSGKTTVVAALRDLLRETVVLERDVLLREEIDWTQRDWEIFRSTWLRLAFEVGQSGRPAVLVGTTWPDDEEPLHEARYFSTINYLCLACDDATLVTRLTARPAWRRSSQPGFVERMRQFNRQAKESRDPRVTLLDTTSLSVAETAERVAKWIRARL